MPTIHQQVRSAFLLDSSPTVKYELAFTYIHQAEKMWISARSLTGPDESLHVLSHIQELIEECMPSMNSDLFGHFMTYLRSWSFDVYNMEDRAICQRQVESYDYFQTLVEYILKFWHDLVYKP